MIDYFKLRLFLCLDLRDRLLALRGKLVAVEPSFSAVDEAYLDAGMLNLEDLNFDGDTCFI